MRKVNKWVQNGNCRLGALFIALAMTTAACGDDSAVAGSQSVNGGDATGGNDGSLSGEDGAAPGDAIGSADGTVTSFVCGNGKCEGPMETAATCPAGSSSR